MATFKSRSMLIGLGLTLCLGLAACGKAAIGESCKTRGATADECEAGGVCDAKAGGATVCLKVCTDDSQCASTEACNGVSGTNIKGCHPK